MIYLVRHGQTKWNKGGVFRGHKDIPLDNKGFKQAKQVAEYLKNKQIKKIFSSPLSRATQTAEVIANKTGVNIEIKENFIDLNFGKWEGHEIDWVANNDPHNYHLYKNEPEKAIFPDGESLTNCLERSYRAFYNLVEEYQDDIIIVTHRVIIKLLLIGVLGLSLNAFWQLHIDTCSTTELTQKSMHFVIRKMNNTCHLDDMELKPDF